MLKINFYGVIRLMNFARRILKKISLHFCLYHLEILLFLAALNVTFPLSKIHLSNYRHYRSLSVVGPIKQFLVETLHNTNSRTGSTTHSLKQNQYKIKPNRFNPVSNLAGTSSSICPLNNQLYPPQEWNFCLEGIQFADN